MTIEEEVDQFFKDHKFEKDLVEKLSKEIKIVVELDGTVTFSGLDYPNFRSLLCSASLYMYDNDKIPSHRQREYQARLEANARGEPEIWAGQTELMREGAEEDRVWRLEQRAILTAIEKVQSAALKRHNDKYSRMERLYFRLTSPIRSFVFNKRKFITAWNKMRKKIRRG